MVGIQQASRRRLATSKKAPLKREGTPAKSTKSTGLFSMREDRTQARNELKSIVAVMFSNQHAPELAEFACVDLDVARKIRAATNEATWGRSDAESVKYVTDEMVEKLCICGTLEDVIRQLKSVEKIGYNQAALNLLRIPNADKVKMMETFIDHVIPKLR
ncbi:MAG: hypothetical protein V1850_03295 [Candidatus Bathyarchaeota archaeon]